MNYVHLKSREFVRQCRALIGLRYRLIWAQARTSQGRIALLLALYLLGAMTALLLAMGGLGAAVAAINLGQGEAISRWMLTSLYANGFGLSLLFGFGARAAFTESALRRYPMRVEQRFAVRHGIGLFDPVWLILVAGALGLVAGLVWLKAGALLPGLLAAALFILASYLTTAVLLSIINRMMQTRTGTALLGGVLIAVFSLGPMVIASLGHETQKRIWEAADAGLRWLPPGVAAGVMVGDDWLAVPAKVSLLIIWCLWLGYLLQWIERRPVKVDSAATGPVVWGNVWDDYTEQVSRLFGHRYGPLVDKSLRYHLRCNLIRYSLITSPLLVIAIRFFETSQRSGGFVFNSALIFYVLSCATGAAMMLNLLGFDGAGIRRYAVMPAPMGDGLRAGSLASLLLRVAAVFAAFLFWLILFWKEPKSWRMMMVLFGVALTGILLFNAIGLWVSIFSAKAAEYDSMWNNRLSFGANAVVLVGILLPFYAGIALVGKFGYGILLRYWWAMGVAAAISGGIYALSFLYLDRALKLQSEALIKRVAGVQ